MSKSNPSLPIYDVELPSPVDFTVQFTYSHPPTEILNLGDRISSNKIQDEPGKTTKPPVPIGIAPIYNHLEIVRPYIKLNPNSNSSDIATANNVILKNYGKLLQINDLASNKITENTFIFVNARDEDIQLNTARKLAEFNLTDKNFFDSSQPKPFFIEQALKANLQQNNPFYNNDEQHIENKFFNVINKVSSRYQLSEFFAHKIFLNSYNDPTTQFNFVDLLNTTKLQDPDKVNKFRIVNDHLIDVKFEIDVTNSSFGNISTVGGEFKVAIAGYLIEKSEFDINGNKTNYCKIILDNGSASHYYDTNINYGFKYSYSVSTIYLIQIKNVSSTTSNLFSFLLLSPQSLTASSECIDDSIPNPPANFDAFWDYSSNRLALVWTFPTQPKRDIKKFQIFRRTDVNQSFELIRQIDFSNDTTIRGDYVDKSSNHISNGPITMFFDDDFKKDSKYIYAVASVSARGPASNYSSQFEISFDKFKNSLIKKLISTQNAPRAYPNLFVHNTAFVQTISTTNFKTLRLFFNPQYYQARHDLTDPCVPEAIDRIVAFNNTDKSEYQLAIINADLQQQQTVKIKINDLRNLTFINAPLTRP